MTDRRSFLKRCLGLAAAPLVPLPGAQADNDFLRRLDAERSRNLAWRGIKTVARPLVVANGTYDKPAFLWDANDMATFVKACRENPDARWTHVDGTILDPTEALP